jgi:hypothetical protein
MDESPKLDFSFFHPLDHHPFSRRCFDHYGGPRQHYRLWWEYKFEYTPKKVWHRLVLCKLGHHRIVEGREVTIMGRTHTTRTWCPWCGYAPK